MLYLHWAIISWILSILTFPALLASRRAATSKAHVVDREDDCVEKGQILIVERTIDKYVFIKARRNSLNRCFRHVGGFVSDRYSVSHLQLVLRIAS